MHAQRTVLVLLLLVLLTATVACSPVAEEPVEPPEDEIEEDLSQYGGRVAFHAASEITTLSHLHSSAAGPGVVFLFMRERLFTLHEETSDWVPQLATDYDVSPCGLEWTIYLREDVKWHDGHPFTADDVIFTAELIRNEDVASIWRGTQYIGDGVLEWEKIDDYTVKLILPEPFAPVLFNLWMSMCPQPKHILENIEPEEIAKSDFAFEPVLTGPFKFEEHRPGEMIRLVRNDDYWGGEPYLDEIIIRIIPDYTAAILGLETGQVDFHVGTAPRDFLRFREEGNLVTVQQPSGNTQYLALNHDTWPFDNVLVRRALMHLIDRETIVNHVFQGLASPAYAPFTPTTMFVDESVQVKYEFSVEAARDLMLEAGFTLNSSGMLEWDGEELEIECYYMAGSEVDEHTLLIIQEAMEEAGIRFIPRAGEWSAWAREIGEGNWQTARLGHGMGPDPDGLAHVYDKRFSSHGRAVWDPQMQELFDQGRAATDPDVRESVYRELQTLMSREAYQGWIYHRDRLMVHNARVNFEEAILNPWQIVSYMNKVYVTE